MHLSQFLFSPLGTVAIELLMTPVLFILYEDGKMKYMLLLMDIFVMPVAIL